MKKISTAVLLSIAALATTACAPEVGSKRWCEKMQETPKGDWTMNEAGDFAKHCLFESLDQGDQ